MDAFDGAVSKLSHEISARENYAITNLLYLSISEKRAKGLLITMDKEGAKIKDANPHSTVTAAHVSLVKLMDELAFRFSVMCRMRRIQ